MESVQQFVILTYRTGTLQVSLLCMSGRFDAHHQHHMGRCQVVA